MSADRLHIYVGLMQEVLVKEMKNSLISFEEQQDCGYLTGRLTVKPVKDFSELMLLLLNAMWRMDSRG